MVKRQLIFNIYACQGGNFNRTLNIGNCIRKKGGRLNCREKGIFCVAFKLNLYKKYLTAERVSFFVLAEFLACIPALDQGMIQALLFRH